MIPRIFNRLAKFCLSQSRRILVVAGLAALGALLSASQIRFDPDILNLVPEHNVEINEFRRVIEELGTIDYHIVVVKVPEQGRVEEYEPLLENLARQYEALSQIEYADYRLPDPVTIVEDVLPHALLLLTPEELERAGEKLTDEAIRESIARNRALLQTPQSTAVKQLIQYDPFNLLPIYIDRFDDAGGGFDFDPSTGLYSSADRSTILLLTKPTRAAQDIPFARELMAASWQIEERVLRNFSSEYPEVNPPEIVYTGGYAIAYDDAQLIKSDVIANVLFSFFGVLVLFFYAFRRIAAIGYAGVPMALGIALTFGLAGLFIGTLSSASAGFAALLAGLGIDFITVLYERYVEERNRSQSVPVALQTTIRSTMPGVVIAAVTTAATFYGFLVTDFRGMTQLGFLTGTGILLFLACVAFVLPSLIIETERNTTKIPKLHLHTFGSDSLMQLCMRKPKTTLAVWGIFILVAGILATNLTFSDNVANLRAKGNRGVLVQDYLTEKFGQSFDFMMLVAEGESVEEVIERTEAVADELDRLVREGQIGAYQSISSFVPSATQQRRVIDDLEEKRETRFSPDRIEGTLESALAEEGFRQGLYD
ncbi:MAG: MMPL family transporter, partial [Thermoanaerobaculia bacterium]|nr:MMPL family transporter [Thermoanaerobaculia bacterium]